MVSIGVTISGITIREIYVRTRKKKKRWNDIVNAFNKLEPTIRDINPDVIVGLADGRIIGALIAVNLRMPIFYSIDVRKDKDGACGPVLGDVGNIDGKKVLLVDNHIYTGNNMREAINFLKSKNPKEIVTLVFFQHELSIGSIQINHYAEKFKGGRRVWPWSLTQEKKAAYREREYK